jgi:predicted nucleic acid-binding protein
MAAYYFDTSALVKYYVPEDGSQRVIATIDAPDDTRNHIIVATVAFAEMCATFGRLIRDGSISQQTSDGIIAIAQQHFQSGLFRRQAITWPLVMRAGQLACGSFVQAGYALRGYDAIQLAAALTAHQYMIHHAQPPLLFVSADKRLLVIAENSGLQTVNPSEQP